MVVSLRVCFEFHHFESFISCSLITDKPQIPGVGTWDSHKKRWGDRRIFQRLKSVV